MTEQAGRLLEALKTILQSPIGGWIIAIGVVCYMGWYTMQDRQVIYKDLMHLREQAMPLLTENQKLAEENLESIKSAKLITEDNNRILQEVRSMMNIPMDNRRNIEEILEIVKEKKSQSITQP